VEYEYTETVGTSLVRENYPTFVQETIYDVGGSPVTERTVVSDTESYVTEHTYDAASNRIATTDPVGRATQFDHDKLGRVVAVVDPKDHKRQSAYDNRGNLIALTDGNGNTTRFEYDRNDRRTKTIRPLGQVTSYSYDQVGNLIEKVNAKHEITAMEYDALNLVGVVRYYTAEDHATPVRVVTFAYDRVGNLTAYDDGVTSAEYVYDASYGSLSESMHYGAFDIAYTYTYNLNGMRESFTGPDGLTYQYTYDSMNRLASISTPGQVPITYAGYQGTNPALVTYPGGASRGYVYDALSRTDAIFARDPAGNVLMSHDYDYSPAGNVSKKDTEHGTYEYSHDELSRLVMATSPYSATETYTYDASGNRLTSAGTDGEWGHGPNNELLGYAEVVFEYDANGNMVSRSEAGKTTQYTYDVENRLTAVRPPAPVLGDESVTFAYDYAGRRVQKRVFVWSGVAWDLTSETFFVYDGWNLAEEVDVTGQQRKAYLWGSDMSGTREGAGGIGGLLSMTDESGVYYYHFDNNGNVEQIVNAINGAPVAQYGYEAFGSAEHVVESAPFDNQFRFSTKYVDDETGLVYYGYRYYSPELGRWLTRDPLEEEGGLNLYAFVGNNPTGDIDPLGKFSWLKFVACFTGMSMNQVSALRGGVTKEMLTDPLVQKEVTKEIANLKRQYGSAWKKVRNKLIHDVRREAVEKVVKKLGKKAVAKWLGNFVVGKAIPIWGQVSTAWDACKAAYCFGKAM